VEKGRQIERAATKKGPKRKFCAGAVKLFYILDPAFGKTYVLDVPGCENQNSPINEKKIVIVE
jgi:hypothetical protein